MDPKELLKRFEPKEMKVVPLDRQMLMVRFSPDGALLAAAGIDGTVRRFDVSADGVSPLPSLAGHGGWVTSIAFHGDGQRLFSSDSWGALRCWPTAEKEAKPQWTTDPAHDGWIRGIALSPDGKLLASCGADGKLRLWSADDGKKVAEFTGHDNDVFSVAFHPDGKSLVSGDLRGDVRQWDIASRKEVRAFDAKVLYKPPQRLQEVGGVRRLAFDAAGAVLACAGAQPRTGGAVEGKPVILLFDWASGKLVQTVTHGSDQDGFVHDLHFHGNGFLMAVSSGLPGKGQVFFHRPGDAQPFFTLARPNCHSLALHPGGVRLVVSGTNADSNHQGRVLNASKEYQSNYSPLHLFELPKPA